MATRVTHEEFVKQALETKAVDFKAIGKLVADLGPQIAMSDEPWTDFCGTMRYFVHFYRWPGPHPGGPVENLGALQGVTSQLRE